MLFFSLFLWHSFVLHLSTFASSQSGLKLILYNHHRLIEIGSVRGALHVAARILRLAIEVLLIIKCTAMIKNPHNSKVDARLSKVNCNQTENIAGKVEVAANTLTKISLIRLELDSRIPRH